MGFSYLQKRKNSQKRLFLLESMEMIQVGGDSRVDLQLLKDDSIQINPVHDLKALEQRLAESDVDIDPTLKKRVYEILLGIQQSCINGKYERPGMIVVLGGDGIKDTDYYSMPNGAQNMFEYGDNPREPVNIRTDLGREVLEIAKDYDGGILINSGGYITDTGVRIDGLNAKQILKEMGIPNDQDLSQRFNFAEGVGNRHITAACAAWKLDKEGLGPITTFTLSEETGIIRVYEGRNIVYSQHPHEPVAQQAKVTAQRELQQA